MIKANELRIGNILKKDSVFVRIDGRSIMDIEYSDVYACKYKPIVLTIGLLKECGFVKEEGYYTFEGFKLWDNDYNFYHMNSEMLIHIDYLHQLQNLYFAVSGGEELVVNL
jgi:hypothetical protein